MVDHDTIWTLAGDSHLEGSGDELGVLVRRHRPPHDLTGEDVEHHGQEEEAGPCRDIRDVGHPPLARSGRGEVTLHEVRRRPGPLVSAGGATELAPGHALDAGVDHEPGHPVASHFLVVLFDQFGPDAPIAIGLPGLGVDQADLLGEDLVGQCPSRRRAVPPAVVAAARDAEEPAHGGRRVRGPVRFDELEPRYGVECVSLANQAAAFFRISFSSSRTRTRRRSWASSAFSSVVGPSVRTPSSLSAWSTQL